jgi:hypothetical protein
MENHAPKKRLVKFAVSFGLINLLSGSLASTVGDWFAIYRILLTGPICSLLVEKLSGFSELRFSATSFAIAIAFGVACSFLPKIMLSAMR